MLQFGLIISFAAFKKLSLFQTVVLGIRATKLPYKWLSNITMFAPCATKQIVISVVIRIADRLAS